jgi:glucoamylase
VQPQEVFCVLGDGSEPPPAGSAAFFVGQGAPPVGAVALRVPGPRGTDTLLALYGTALIQEKAGLAFRATSLGQAPPASAPFDPGLLQGLIKSLGRPTSAPPPAPPAQGLEAQRLNALAQGCWAKIQSHILPNGAIVASPAKGEQPGQPNYWFVWQRDAGQTLLGMIEWARTAPFGLPVKTLEAAIASYVGFLTRSQASGDLGVSRYTVDGQPVRGYGNPQLDGPAISALALTRLSDPRPVYPQIRAYLEYLLTSEGSGPCYDAWEFVYGRVLNALLLKRKAFRSGARLAYLLNEEKEMRRYRDEAARLETEIDGFRVPTRGYLLSSKDAAEPFLETISRLDVATLGAVLTAWDANDDFLNLTHPAVMGTVLALEDAFAPLYTVNRAWHAAGHTGMGWGRFPEDANDGVGSTGGNPWPLVTLWAAQYCYLLETKLAAGGPFPITDQRQADYLNRVTGQEAASVGGQVPKLLLSDVLSALRRRGDAYVQFVLAHQPPDGSLTEQVNRESGQPQGARDLTWALAELLKTLALRG